MREALDFDFKSDLEINPDQLDLEWLRQPALYFKYAAAAAEARDHRDRLKEKLEVVKAQLTSKIRFNPSDYGFVGDKKPTEGAIESTTIQQTEYEEANDRYLKAKLECDLIQSAVTSMEQKKSALENMVRLMNSGYCAVPTVPRNVGEEWRRLITKTKEDQQAETTDRMLERAKRRKTTE